MILLERMDFIPFIFGVVIYNCWGGGAVFGCLTEERIGAVELVDRSGAGVDPEGRIEDATLLQVVGDVLQLVDALANKTTNKKPTNK